MTAVDLADPLGNVIQEVAIVRDGKHRTLIVVQEVLEPQDRLSVQVVRGLVEQQQVGSLEQQLAQGHTAALAAGKHVDRHVGIGQLQGVHGLAELGIDIPAVGGVDLVLELSHLGHEASMSQSGSHISSPILLKRSTLAIMSPNAMRTFSMTVLSSSSGGSCCRIPTV